MVALTWFHLEFWKQILYSTIVKHGGIDFYASMHNFMSNVVELTRNKAWYILLIRITMLVEKRKFWPVLDNCCCAQFGQIYKIFQLSFFTWALCENMFIFPICLQATTSSDMFVFKIFIAYQLNWQKYGLLTELNYL